MKAEIQPLQLDSDTFFVDVYSRFAASPYGEVLNGRARWDRYKPSHIAVDNWIELLGPDIDNLQHHVYSFWLAQGFVDTSNSHTDGENSIHFTEEEARILLLAALCNDWAEAHPDIGDVNYEQKTVDDTEKERKYFGPIFDEVIGTDLPKYRFMVEDIIFGKRESKLGKAWDAIERISYLHDALSAFTISQSIDALDPTLAGHLRWMAAGGLSNQTGILLEYSREFSAVSEYLSQNSANISAAYDAIEPTIFATHGQKERTRLEQYLYEKRIWQTRGVQSASSIETEIRHSLEDVPTDRIDRIMSLLRLYGEMRSRSSTGSNLQQTGRFNRGVFGTETNFDARYLPDIKAVTQVSDAIRTLGLKIVLTSGTFDMWHIGHARYLELAKKHGDFLIVGVDSDEKVKGRKGPNRPLVPESERLEIVAHDRSVDAITIKGKDEPRWALIKAVLPDTLILTAETYGDDELAALEQFCGKIVVLPPQATTSTSSRIRSLNMDFGRQLVDRLPHHVDRIIEDIIRNG